MRGAAARAVIAAALGAVALIPATGMVHAETADEPVELCRFDGTRLAEISGLAYSAQHDQIVWAHNDSGGGPRLYALDVATCEIQAVLRVQGTRARDPEAIAVGTGVTGAPVLWWGDVGDNTASRRFVEIVEVPEPTVLRSGSVRATPYRVRLDQPQDAEALLADGDRLWLIGKGLLGGTVWQLPQPLRADRTGRARPVGTEEALVTDAAMRPGGGYAVRDYSEVRIYSGEPPGTLIDRMPLPQQIQGEAMTWTPDGTGLIIASEGDDRLLLVPVDVPVNVPPEAPEPDTSPSAAPAPAATAPESAAPTASAEASPQSTPVVAALEPVDRIGSLAVIALAIGAAVFAVSATAVVLVARLRR